jgi:O-antigen ligase
VAVFFVLLSSRTLLLLFALLPVPAFLWYRLQKKRRSQVWLLAVALLIAGSATFIAFTDNPVRNRFIDIARTEDLQEAFLPDYRAHDQKFNNLTTRLFLWRVGIETAREHNLWWRGAGAGDVHYLTDARMDELGIRDIYNDASPSYFHGTNMHNMPLQVLLTVGLLGVFLLLWMLVAPIVRQMRGVEGIFWRTLAVTFALVMLQEAAFQTQAGIVPFAFFTNLFWNRYWQVKKATSGRPVKSV